MSPTTASHVINGIGRYLGPGMGCSTAANAGSASNPPSSTPATPHCGCSDPVLWLSPPPRFPPTPLPSRSGIPVIALCPSLPSPLVTDSAELPTPRGRQQLGLLAPAEIDTPAGYLRLGSPEDDTEFARGLYAQHCMPPTTPA